jgi:hypothetical protein
MPLSQRPPVSMSPFKARLTVLRRPMVWASASVLLAAGYALFQYWNGAEQSANLTNSASQDPSLRSPLLETNRFEDGGSTDLGDLPGLSNQLEPDALSASEPATQKPVPLSSSTVNRSNRINNTAESLPMPSPGLPSSAFNANTFNSSNTTNPASDDRSTPISPLQSALDRNVGGSSALTQSEPAADRITEPATAESATAGNFPQSFSSGRASQFQPFIPRTSPPPGTTGYTLPPAFRTPATGSSINDAGSGFTNFSRLQPVPGVTSQQSGQLPLGYGQSRMPTQGRYSPSIQPQAIQPQAIQPQIPQADSAPFSIPRTAPGRSIGGGQINTFSNP